MQNPNDLFRMGGATTRAFDEFMNTEGVLAAPTGQPGVCIIQYLTLGVAVEVNIATRATRMLDMNGLADSLPLSYKAGDETLTGDDEDDPDDDTDVAKISGWMDELLERKSRNFLEAQAALSSFDPNSSSW